MVVKATSTGVFTSKDDIKWTGLPDSIKPTNELSSDKKTITTTFQGNDNLGTIDAVANYDGQSLSLKVKVYPEVSSDTLLLSPQLSSNETDYGLTLPLGNKKIFSLFLKGMKQIPSDKVTVSSDNDDIAGISKSNNSITISGRGLGTTVVRIKAFGVEALAIQVNVGTIDGFRPLEIRLDMMDDQTARDLFGRKAVDEYFIAKVRLFNRIDRNDRNFGDSILVYSESLQVNVAVEWRHKDVNGGNSTNWDVLTKRDALTWFPKLPLHNPNSVFEKKCRSGKPSYEVGADNKFIVPYRPLTYDMVLNTHDRRDSRSKRSRVLLVMHSALSLTSFITAIAVPGPGSDLPVGLEKFRNLFIPSFEKLFPSQTEVQRQNFSLMVMRPLEEIPFGSDITHIVFFPKRKISGVLFNQSGKKETELRISAIDISDACAEAAIITKLSNTIP